MESESGDRVCDCRTTCYVGFTAALQKFRGAPGSAQLILINPRFNLTHPPSLKARHRDFKAGPSIPAAAPHKCYRHPAAAGGQADVLIMEYGCFIPTIAYTVTRERLYANLA